MRRSRRALPRVAVRRWSRPIARDHAAGLRLCCVCARGRGREPELLRIRIGKLDTLAAAASAVGRVVRLPPGMVVTRDDAVPGQVLGPGAAVVDGVVHQPGRVLRLALDHFPAPLGAGHADFGVEDDAQPPGRPELAAPSALVAQQRLELILKVLEGMRLNGCGSPAPSPFLRMWANPVSPGLISTSPRVSTMRGTSAWATFTPTARSSGSFRPLRARV